MSEPTFSTTTERIYARLPETYRIMDAKDDYVFKRWLSGIGDVLDDIFVLNARFTYIPDNEREDFLDDLARTGNMTYARDPMYEDPEYGFDPTYATSDLLDGRTSNAEWLRWQAQMVGADVEGLETDEQRRLAVIYAFKGYKAGSREAMTTGAMEELTGSRYVRVYPQYRLTLDGQYREPGTEWDVLLISKWYETPPDAELVAALVRKGAKPAGVTLYHLAYSIWWQTMAITLPTWDSIEALLTWDNFMDYGSEAT